MRKLKTLLIVTLILGMNTQSYAMLPVIDGLNIFQTMMVKIEAYLQRAEMVKQTANMASQLARLWAIYSNAKATYESIGNAVDSVKNFNASSIARSWMQDLEWDRLGTTLNRWGIKPAETGVLAELDESLFGPDPETGLTIEGMFDNISELCYRIPGQYSRDSFAARTVEGIKRQQEEQLGGRNNNPIPAPRRALADKVDVDNIDPITGKPIVGEVPELIKVETINGKEYKMRLNEDERVELTQIGIDTDIGKLNGTIAMQLYANKQDETAWEQMMNATKSNGHTAQLELSQDQRLLLAQGNKKINELIEFQMAKSTTELQALKLQTDELIRQDERARNEAEVVTAIGSM